MKNGSRNDILRIVLTIFGAAALFVAFAYVYREGVRKPAMRPIHTPLPDVTSAPDDALTEEKARGRTDAETPKAP